MRLLVMSMFILALAAMASAQVNKDLDDLANAERAFAAETVKVGFRDGFIKYFADDGIGFGPHPSGRAKNSCSHRGRRVRER